MKKINSTQIILFLFGIIAIGIGFSILFFPVQFEASADIKLEINSSLLSEIRAFGGLIFTAGILIWLGVFKSNLIQLSLTSSVILYLIIGLSRLVGILLDGVPSHSIILATIAELLIGAISLIMLLKLRNKTSKSRVALSF